MVFLGLFPTMARKMRTGVRPKGPTPVLIFHITFAALRLITDEALAQSLELRLVRVQSYAEESDLYHD